jgi:hypothetical protein
MPEKAINLLKMEDNEVDVINVKQTLKKVNIINLVHPTIHELEGLLILHCDRRQPRKIK